MMKLRVVNRIALRYILNGRFGVDLIASLPLDVISLIYQDSESQFKFLGLLKLVRLLRLGRMITFLKANQNLKFSVKIAQLVFFLLLINHWINCIWYMTTSAEQTWFPPKDLDFRETGAYTDDMWSRYNLFFYYGILILVGNEVLPTDNTELLVLTLITFLSTIGIGVIIGEFAALLEMITKKERVISQEFDIVNNVMHSLRTPEALQDRILYYLDNVNESQFIKNLHIYTLLSPSLAKMIKVHQIHKSVGFLDFVNHDDYSQIEYLCK
jgi:type III secretory pathway component EscS